MRQRLSCDITGINTMNTCLKENGDRARIMSMLALQWQGSGQLWLKEEDCTHTHRTTHGLSLSLSDLPASINNMTSHYLPLAIVN